MNSAQSGSSRMAAIMSSSVMAATRAQSVSVFSPRARFSSISSREILVIDSLLIFMCRPGGDDPANFPSHRVDDSDDAVGLWADRQRPDFSVSDGLKLDPEFLQSEHGIFK